MSIENMMERNRDKAEAETRDFRYHLIRHTPEQESITKEWILPYQDSILADTRELRREVDRELNKDPETRKRMHLWDKRYPDGLCLPIRDAVFEKMKGAMLDAQRPGMKSLKQFVRAGGVIKEFWGIDKEMYFQNAIQIGTSILDVSNDTVTRTKEPVVFYPDIREAPIKNIESFEQFADVSEKYWHRDIYPNIYLPWFAPVFPIISIIPADRDLKHQDTLQLEDSAAHLVLPNLYTLHDQHLFGLSDKFLTKSKYSEKRLPEEMLDRLLNSRQLRGLSQTRPDMFKITTDPEEAMARIKEFHWDLENPPADEKKVFDSYIQETSRMMDIAKPLHNRSLASIQRS